MSTSETLYLIDTSVLLRAAMGDSPAAASWFAAKVQAGEHLVGSRMLALEARRFVKNRQGRELPVDELAVISHLETISLSPVDEGLIASAEALTSVIRSADSLHLATALRLARYAGQPDVVVVTHDRQMAAAAGAASLPVVDPVTDDEQCPPVAPLER